MAVGDDMIQRIARTVSRQIARQQGKTVETAENFADAVWKDFIPLAQAILKDLREPTADMLSAAMKADPSPAIPVQWRAMIDAARAADE